jgi:FAD/FMN-containing dehydrogenase
MINSGRDPLKTSLKRPLEHVFARSHGSKSEVEIDLFLDLRVHAMREEGPHKWVGILRPMNSQSSRRTFMRWMGWLTAMMPMAGGLLAGCARWPLAARPGTDGWPSPGQWGELSSAVGGRLMQPTSPFAACVTAGPLCEQALADMKNPFFVERTPGATQSTGWLGAWSTRVSPYAVAVESAADIAATVAFASKHNLRLVVKGTGHDYFGRSNAADSLLIWTHRMRGVESHEAFVPIGAPAGTTGVQALSAQAGARWLEGYIEATTRMGRYVQGGGCTTVGMAGGFMQGGGFGSFSRRYGTGAASMIEAEVITADGQVRVCNEFQEADLFWALKGGGGGTFGVVSRVTLATHDMPTQAGILSCTIAAGSDQAMREVLDRFVMLWKDTLCTANWGEKISVSPDNKLELVLVFNGLSPDQANAVFAPFIAWAKSESMSVDFSIMDLPFRKAWDLKWFEKTKPSMVKTDDSTGGSASQFWWAGDSGQVSRFIWSYFGRYMPVSLLQDSARCSRVLYEASRHATVEVHINKGLAGAAPEAIERTRGTSMNPKVLDAAGLFILAGGQSAIPGVPGHEPDVPAGRAELARLRKAFDIVRDATPGAGSYVNESDYFDQDWGNLYWGEHYARLCQIKKAVDPDGLFCGHHLVGSEN